MRGDHSFSTASAVRRKGPPPHARGSPASCRARWTPPGPTPACAGITSSCSRAAHASSAHPRMRGDHEQGSTTYHSAWGPPPHARGSQARHAGARLRTRPTPACAGITPSTTAPHGSSAAHPRMRGDHRAPDAAAAYAAGPPPHARGSRRRVHARPHGRRPTPACAGITRGCSRARGSRSAHPRMRGDHPTNAVVSFITDGPPPHARGSRLRRRTRGPRDRPTPACAGITCKTPSQGHAERAHPRMRGDHHV